ncbi:recombinase family protein [Crassaminicella profunda]|uniref:recombinase family protein n=1 Tax=Crassaminicella profunda TaxID=1286698 RepID=UPI001CA7A0C3|nr:recombinase family protein [Crassaminicella profunda]QZY56490.1 recombinase family protein [Crassaminicella profunda]
MTIQSTSNTSNAKENQAIAYIRVSTKRQKEKGNSPEVQRRYAENYAKKNGLEIIEYVEESKSASKIVVDQCDFDSSIFSGLKNRPALLKLLANANKNNLKHLIVSSRDRLARNLEVYVGIKYFLQKQKIQLHFSAPGESMHIANEAFETFTELVFANVAELEANLISIRVRDGMAQRVKNNSWPGGRLPYGYILDADKNISKSTPNEEQDIQKIFNLFTQYVYSYRKIAEIMNRNLDEPYWTKNKIDRIINNKVYQGKIVWGITSRRNFITEDHRIINSPAIQSIKMIEKDTWEHAQKLRYKKSTLKDTKYYSTPFLLRDKLVCGNCGEPLEAKNYGKDKYGKKREGVYRCACRKNYNDRNDKMIFKKHILENTFMEEFFSKIKPKESNTLWKYYTETKEKVLEDHKKNLKVIQNSLQETDGLITNLDKLIAIEKNKSLKETLMTQRVYYDKQKTTLQNYKKELEVIPTVFFDEQSKLDAALYQFFSKDFNTLINEQKRMIIDLLINKIIVSKVDNQPKLNIYINTSIDIL